MGSFLRLTNCEFLEWIVILAHNTLLYASGFNSHRSNIVFALVRLLVMFLI